MGVVGVVVQEVASGANIVQLVNDCTRCVACGYDAVLLWDSWFARPCFASSYQRLSELSSTFASTVAGFRVAPSNDGVRCVLVCVRMSMDVAARLTWWVALQRAVARQRVPRGCPCILHRASVSHALTPAR